MSKPRTNALPAMQESPLTTAEKTRLTLMPSVNSATVIEAYQTNVMGKDTDINLMIEGLRETFTEVNNGDLSAMEAMLVGQATALQTIFTSLARRAANQEQLRQYETFLGLALKAQTQCRATISALVELKYPRQAMFVKQANIAHGPQQVNYGAATLPDIAHAEKSQPDQNKLLEDKTHERPYLDIGTTPATERSDQAVEAVDKINRAKKSRR